MKAYKIWLIILKFAMIIQFVLIFTKVQSEHDTVYLITDMLFKISLGTFLILYFYINGSPMFDGWDEVFIGFGGTLLIFDALYNVLPKILANYKIYFNPYTLTVSNAPITTEA
jgi:hypothetical protein